MARPPGAHASTASILSRRPRRYLGGTGQAFSLDEWLDFPAFLLHIGLRNVLGTDGDSSCTPSANRPLRHGALRARISTEGPPSVASPTRMLPGRPHYFRYWARRCRRSAGGGPKQAARPCGTCAEVRRCSPVASVRSPQTSLKAWPTSTLPAAEASVCTRWRTTCGRSSARRVYSRTKLALAASADGSYPIPA